MGGVEKGVLLLRKQQFIPPWAFQRIDDIQVKRSYHGMRPFRVSAVIHRIKPRIRHWVTGLQERGCIIPDQFS